MSNESFTIEKIVEDTFDEKLESNMELLRETLRDNKEFGINTVSFWLAFLSLSMIIFTILSALQFVGNKVYMYFIHHTRFGLPLNLGRFILSKFYPYWFVKIPLLI